MGTVLTQELLKSCRNVYSYSSKRLSDQQTNFLRFAEEICVNLGGEEMEMDMKTFEYYLGFVLTKLNYDGYRIRSLIVKDFCHDLVVILMAQYQISRISWGLMRFALVMIITTRELMNEPELYLKS